MIETRSAGGAPVALEFSDARGFKEWMKLVPLMNVRQAHSEILEVLQQFDSAQIVPIELLKILEQLRDPAELLQSENAKRFTNKPFPLAEAEEAVWSANIAFWQAMCSAYYRCWEDAQAGAPDISEHLALCAQRTLRYFSLLMREYHLAWRLLPSSRWGELYRLYRKARDAGIHTQAVKDKQNRQTELSSCDACLAQAVLLARSDPFGMTMRQILWGDFVLDRWSNQVSWLDEFPVGDERPVFAIHPDIAEPASKTISPMAGSGWLYLDTQPIGRSIRKRVKMLREGGTPAKLNLGEEISVASAESQLTEFYREWCGKQVDRAQIRSGRDALASIGVIANMEDIYHHLAGKPFTQPDAIRPVSARTAENIQLFGHRGEQESAEPENASLPPNEAWKVLNESALGYRLHRANPGCRISHQQLLLIQDKSPALAQMGKVRWICQGENNDIEIGVTLLPGKPEATSIRAIGISSFGNKFTPAVFLAPLPPLLESQQLILPSGWFKPGRLIELLKDGRIVRIKLETLHDRGADFELISFSGDQI